MRQIEMTKKANTRRIDGLRELEPTTRSEYFSSLRGSTVCSSKLGRLASFRLIVGVRKKKGKRERKSAEQRTRREKKEEKEEKGEVTTRKRETTPFCKCTG